MKLAVIQIHDKSNRIKRDFALTDENPLAHIEKSGNTVILKENIDCELAEKPVRFMSVQDILEEYTRQEIIWLQSPEIIKQMDKCISLFKKIEGMVNDATFEKSQQQIEFGIKALGMPVEMDNGEVEPFTAYKNPKLSENEWNVVCRTAYRFATEYKDKEVVGEVLWREGYIENYYKDIAWIYVDFINKVHDKNFCEEQMLKLRDRYLA